MTSLFDHDDEHESSADAPPKSARRRARELALQGVYQWLVSNEDVGAIQAHLATDRPDYAQADRDYFATMLKGTIDEADRLRAQFEPFLDRRAAELSPVEQGVLLIGSFELTHHLEVPYRVVINEAVEIAKSFGGTDGHKYVNGVLDKVAAQVRPTEVQARRSR